MRNIAEIKSKPAHSENIRGVREMIKALKVMLIPNNVQQTKLFQYAGAARFAYNWALAREKENYERGGKFISDSRLRKEFTKLRNADEYAWLSEISNNVTKQAIKDACNAYRNFFGGGKAEIPSV